MFVDVQHELQDEAHGGAAEADEPAQQRVVRERRRRRPDPDVEVVAREALELGAAAEQPERDLADRPLQHDQRCADRRRDQQRAA